MTPEQSEFFAQFYKEYKQFLYYIVWRHTTDPEDVEDVVQDCWIRLIRQVDKLMVSEPPGIRKYISRTADSSLADHCRRKHPEHPRIPLEEDAFDLERMNWDFLSDLDARSQIKTLEAELPQRDLAALKGKFYYGYSDAELGRWMGVKPASVRTLIGRIRRKARAILLRGSLTGGGGNER